MEAVPNIIVGGIHTDLRGNIKFINEFDMSPVKRFYIVEHRDIKTIRAWRLHKIEQRWFHVIEGEFLVRLVKIENWEFPRKDLPIKEFILSAEKLEVLYIPSGYGSYLKATKRNSKLLVFADYGIDNAKNDDYLLPEDYFQDKLNE